MNVYTATSVYTTLSELEFMKTSDAINNTETKYSYVFDCYMKKTNYGSVIITKMRGKDLEVYPSIITHITYTR